MKKISSLVWIVLFLSLYGCRPFDDVYSDDTDLVVTDYDKDTDFGTKKTYALSDSIIKLFTADFSNGDSVPDFVGPSASVPIIAKVNANMVALGYTKVSDPKTADVTVLLSVMQSTQVYYYYDYYYWDWYYPYYWYYPFPVTSVSTVKSGTLMMQMLSNKDVNSDKRARIIWLGLVNGLLEGSTQEISNRVSKSIDQAFTQSPYLKH